MRRLIAYVATSADGYIARPDGDVAWLERPESSGDYGLKRFYGTIDAILWGRKTYEAVLEFQRRGIPEAAFDLKVANYVVSRTPPGSAPEGVTFVREPLEGFVERLRAAPGKNVWVMGGAGLIGSLLDAGALDEIVAHVIPVLIGEGIPLVAPRRRAVALDLRSTRRYADGVVRLHYDVRRDGLAGAGPLGYAPRQRR